jgi:hypothetical protein
MGPLSSPSSLVLSGPSPSVSPSGGWSVALRFGWPFRSRLPPLAPRGRSCSGVRTSAGVLDLGLVDEASLPRPEGLDAAPWVGPAADVGGETTVVVLWVRRK